MSREDLIKLAREAGIDLVVPDPTNSLYVTVEYGTINLERFLRFAALVAASEREACALVCEGLPTPDGYSETDQSLYDVAVMDCATAIRARGQS